MKFTRLSLALAVACLLAGHAQAAVFCVGSSAALTQALDIADNNGQSDDIRLQSGTFAGNFLYNANVTETGDLTVRGGYDAACTSAPDGPGNTILDGAAAGRTLVLSGRDNSSLSVSNLTVRNGLGQTQGAGLDVDRWVSASITGSVFRDNNTAAGQDGSGGLEVDRSNTVLVTGNVFAFNNGGKGGGLSLSDFASAVVERNAIISNNATQGGGGLDADTAGSLTLSGNLFAVNTSGQDGGAISLNLDTIGGSGSAQATNNTLVSNTAVEDGGGIDLKMTGDATSVSMHNNLFWANSAGLLGDDMNIDNDDDENGVAAAVELENNNFNQSFVGFFTQLPVAVPASNFNAVTPGFVNLAAGDYHLAASSLMIDAGDSGAPALAAQDLDSAPRVQGSTVDIGAYEASADSDGDGVADFQDNCTQAANASQTDSDGDGFGNACDADLNNSGFVDLVDLVMFKARFGSSDADADFNGDGTVNLIDLVTFKALFGLPPGPSGLNP